MHRRYIPFLFIICAAAALAVSKKSLAQDEELVPYSWRLSQDTDPYYSVSAARGAELNVSATLKSRRIKTPEDKQNAQFERFALSQVFSKNVTGSTGIAFEFRGDGSRNFASVLVNNNTNILQRPYEAILPLNNFRWQKIELYWQDFAENIDPASLRNPLNATNTFFQPTYWIHLGFGRSTTLYPLMPESLQFSARNFVPIYDPPPNKTVRRSPKLKKLKAKLEKQAPINVLLLGDYITALGAKQSYGHYAIKKLADEYGSTVNIINASLDGHSVRSGKIALPWSTAQMPKPDLVSLYYGAEDLPAFNRQGQLDFSAFASHFQALITQLDNTLPTPAELVLLNGIPKLSPFNKNLTTGETEQLVPGIRQVAQQTDALFCDTMSMYLVMEPDQRLPLYSDTEIPSPAGNRNLGELMYQCIKNSIN